MSIQRKPTLPGAVLREDVLQPLGLTITEAAKRLRVHRRTLSALLHEKTALSPMMAIRLAKATHTSPESWLYMQAKFDLWNAEQQSFETVETLELPETLI
jgi:addiction module HigA family antidote